MRDFHEAIIWLVLLLCLTGAGIMVLADVDGSETDGNSSEYQVSGKISEAGRYVVQTFTEMDGSDRVEKDINIPSDGGSFSLNLDAGSYYLVIFKVGGDEPYFEKFELNDDNSNLKLNSGEKIGFSTVGWSISYQISAAVTKNNVSTKLKELGLSVSDQQSNFYYLLDEKTHLADLVLLAQPTAISKKGTMTMPATNSDLVINPIITVDGDHYYVSNIGSGAQDMVSKTNPGTIMGKFSKSITFNGTIIIDENALYKPNAGKADLSSLTLIFEAPIQKICAKAFYATNTTGYISYSNTPFDFNSGKVTKVYGSIGNEAFSGAPFASLNIDMPYGGQIGDSAFANTKKLKSLSISSYSSSISVGSMLLNGNSATTFTGRLDKIDLTNVAMSEGSSFATAVLYSKEVCCRYSDGFDAKSQITESEGVYSYNGKDLFDINAAPVFGTTVEKIGSISYVLAEGTVKGQTVCYARVVSLGTISSGTPTITIPAQIEVGGKLYTVTEIGTGTSKNQIIDNVYEASGGKFEGEILNFKLEISADIVVNDYAFYYSITYTTPGGDGNIDIHTGLAEILGSGRITKVGVKAFYKADITGIDLTDVTEIKEEAFEGSTLSGELTIPDSCQFIGIGAFSGTKINSLQVGQGTIISKGAFKDCKELTDCSYSGDIPESAFEGCVKLTNLRIGSTAVDIGPKAFKNTGITSLDFTEIKSVGDSAFSGTPIASLEIPSTTAFSGGSHFAGCTSLSSVTSRLAKIPEKCFSGDTALTSFNSDVSDLEVGAEAFKDTRISSFDFTKVKTIGGSAFENTGITSLDLGSGVTLTGTAQFKGCTSLSQVTYGLVSVPDSCFEGCTSLSSMTLSNATSVGNAAFSGCISLSTVVMEKVETIAAEAFKGIPLSSVTLSEALTSIGEAAFAGTKITTIVIPSSVTKIEKDAFSGCADLEKVKFENSMEEICQGTFSDCVKLKDLTFPSGLTTIGSGAFKNCSQLDISEISVPTSSDGVLKWSKEAFTGSGSIVKETITETEGYYEYLNAGPERGSGGSRMFLLSVVGAADVPDKGDYVYRLPSNLAGIYSGALDQGITAVSIENNSIYSTVDGVLFKEGGKVLVRAPVYTEFYEIPSGVTEIGQAAFKFSALEEIYVPSTVERIDGEAFGWSNNLRKVIFNEGLKTIEKEAFRGCDIRSLDIPTSIVSIGQAAFLENKNLYQLDLPSAFSSSSVSIGLAAFSGGIYDEVILPNFQTDSNNLIFSDTLERVYLPANSNQFGNKLFNSGSKIGFYLPAGTDKTTIVFDKFGGCAEGKFIEYYTFQSDGSIVTFKTTVQIGEYGIYFKSDVGDLTVNATSVEGSCTFSITAEGGYTYHDLTLTCGNVQCEQTNGQYTLDVDSDLFVNVTERQVDEWFEISFDSNGGSSVKTVKIGSGRTMLDAQYPVPTKDCMEFAGWFITDSVEFTRDTPVDESMRLVAHWTQSTPMIRFHADLGSVTASLGGSGISDGTRVAKGSAVSFTYDPASCSEFVQWQVSSDGKEWTVDDRVLTLDGVNNDLTVTVKERYHSNSSGIAPLISTDTPGTNEDLSILWNTSFLVDTSSMKWTGHSSVPLIVDDHVYVRASDRLYMIETDTGYVTKSVQSSNVTDYYHYLGYAHGLIVDYATGKVYDCNLEGYDASFQSVSSVFFDETSTYVYGNGTLTKYDPSLKTQIWTKTLDHQIFGQYGTTSSVVSHGGYLYYIYASSQSGERGICAIDASTGNESAYLKLDKISGFYLDDGWMTCYGDTLYMTCYTVGLFNSKAGDGTEGYVVAVPISGQGFGTPTFTASASQANSEFVVYNGRGYVNAGYSLIVYDVNGTTLKEAYSVSTAYSHGGIVVDTAGATEENGQEVLIYLIPYLPRSGLMIATDHQGQTSGNVVNKTVGTPQYNSQAVRSTSDGKLVWYTDSGNIYSVGSSRMNDYYFFVEGPAKTAWYHATGATAADALASLGSDVVTLDGSKQLSTVGGSSATGWKIWALSSAKQATGPSDYSWKELSNLYDAVNDTIHYYVVSKAAPRDGAKYSYIDGSSVKTYEFAKNIGDRDIVGQTLIAGEGKIVSLKFYDGDAEIDGSELIGKEGDTVEGSFPSIYKSGWSGYWVDESDGKVTTLPDKFPSESKTYRIVWVQNSYAMKISYSEVGSASYFSLETERTTGDKDVLQGRILLIATYDGGKFVNVYSDELTFDADGKAEAKVMGVSTKDLVIVHAYLVSGTPKEAFESYGECAYTVNAG